MVRDALKHSARAVRVRRSGPTPKRGKGTVKLGGEDLGNTRGGVDD